MSGTTNLINISTIISVDSITVQLIPQKKGIILRHVEYLVKSERFRSEVNRRYSDFQSLYELLLQRFPYRIVPKLPPAKLMAKVAGVDSDTIDQRRKALTRWLSIVTSHPAFSMDLMIKFFLTDISNDFANYLKDQFRHLPDEFMLNEDGPRARDVATPGLRASVMAYRTKMSSLLEVLHHLGTLFGSMVRRQGQTATDIDQLSKEFALLSNSDVSPTSEWTRIKEQMYSASKQFSLLGKKYAVLEHAEDDDCLQKVLLLLDVLNGFEDLSQRHEKGLAQDQKRGMEKLGMIKRRDTRGVLAVNSTWREQIEQRIGEHEIVLSDLESRQAFALLCINEETKLCLLYFEILGNLLESLSSLENKHLSEISTLWANLIK
ncbi:sorting nexin-8 [Eurytemora carolleeae]|uniref:sorting nexin-8 n=1 Tax=Eurytemora carolleeae TaxID=1294199 RepID=UPI000C764BE6|nr:sorting nexin-8 [Eurytemora carolleeae]|eukprot:XP_023349115.1 sorting nexin-8-like [Eurytemora affinis]